VLRTNAERGTSGIERGAHAPCRSSFVAGSSGRGQSLIPLPLSGRVPHSSLSARRGFTLIELILGAAVMTMVLAALAALTLAVADGWRDAETPQGTRVSMSRGANRFLEMIRSARYLGWAGQKSDGSGSVVLVWERDEQNAGTMQLSEIVLLEFAVGPKTVTLYRVPATADNANLLCDVGDIDEEADVAAFKKSGNVVAQVVLHDVVELGLWALGADADKQRPSLEYSLRIESGQDRSWSYETVTLRAPSARPVKCAGGSSCTCTVSGGCTCASAKSCACDATMPCRSSSIAACRETGTSETEED
jgi:type II secretory pathway pseudopilin PulG